MSRVARVVDELAPSGIRKFFDIVAQMDDVVSLGVGEPDFITPWRAREAAIFSLERGYTQYTSNWGLIELRREVSALLARRYGVEYRPENEILITVGVSEGLDLAFRAILNPGDEVLIPEPCYVSYSPTTRLAGGVPVTVRCEVKDGFRVRPEALQAAVTQRTRAILLNFPNNPTGATFSEADLELIAQIARQHDLVVISDEIYSELTYDRRHVCLASLPGMLNRTILLNGFSKAFAMTGFRVAYAAGPADLVGAMTKIHQYTMLAAPITSQLAAVEACRSCETEMEEMVAQYDQRRRVIVRGLNDLGLECQMPTGAFYAFPSVESTGLGSEEFAEQLLREERVAVVPGTAFGAGGESHVRCSYASGMEQIHEALRRMERFVKRLTPPARRIGAAVALGLCALLSPSTSVSADELIQLPTADRSTAPTAGYRRRFNGPNEGYGTITLPATPLGELLFRYYDREDGKRRAEIGGQFQVLPDGLVTPGLSVGMWDVGNNGPWGRRAFLVLTKNLTPFGQIPIPKPFERVQFNIGAGTGRFGGAFSSVRADLPGKISLIGEFDSRRLNAGIWLRPLRQLTLKGELQNGNPYLGFEIRAGL